MPALVALVAVTAVWGVTFPVVKDAGFADAVHVGGGVLAWISQVDPSLPAY